MVKEQWIFFIYNYPNIKMGYEAEGRECKTSQKSPHMWPFVILWFIAGEWNRKQKENPNITE